MRRLGRPAAALLVFAGLVGCQGGPEKGGLSEGFNGSLNGSLNGGFDLLLVGGTVIDGTGAPGTTADVGVRGDRIVAVAPELDRDSAVRVIDVTGLAVAPGFWDSHAHIVDLESKPLAENFVRQGITTILAPLHSQDQPYPIDEYRDRVEMAPNVGLFAGHTWIRKRVMGLEDRSPTDEELDRMRELVAQAMRRGALGLSTGLEYVPAIYAEVDEIVALAEVAAHFGGIYVTHLRDEGPRVVDAVDEALQIGRRAGLPVQINHLKVTGAAQWGRSESLLEAIDAARASGLEVAFDVYPYTAFSTYSDLLFPAWALAEGTEAFARRAADPATRERIVREMLEIFPQQTGGVPESVRFRELPAAPEWEGRTLAGYLAARESPESAEGTPTAERTVEALIELQIQGGFIGIFYGMSEDDVRRIMRHPGAMFETDGDLVVPGEGHPHPRSYGSFPRVLGHYVREEGVLTMEDAVHRMTGLPSEWMGQADRGVLLPGKLADIVVFDPETVEDRSRYTDPHHYPAGIVHLLVNGEPVLLDGAMTGARPGRFLSRGR